MLRRVSLPVLGAFLLLASVGAAPASAQIGIGPGAYGLGFFNYNGGYAANYRIPYYALFPPVYYSYPVARTYGFSPFAYPPGTRTPQLTPPMPAVEFRNPFVEQKSSAETSKLKPAETTLDKAAAASPPRMYYNPFVKQAVTQTASTK